VFARGFFCSMRARIRGPRILAQLRRELINRERIVLGKRKENRRSYQEAPYRSRLATAKPERLLRQPPHDGLPGRAIRGQLH
jgi:hypothetical protein